MAPIVRDKPWHWVKLLVALTMTGRVCAERYQTRDDSAKPQAVATLDAVDAAPAEQVVVLQDGGILRGRVTRNGERYVLACGTSETFIPANNVLLVAASLEDAYHQRHERLDRPTAGNHLVLAEWCLRHDLLTHAERELADARALDPHHDQLELFERRLALANERQQKQAAVVARAATWSQPVAPATPPAPTDVGDLPPGAVERFTRKVQPVLVNSCTLAGCHQLGGTTKFQLDRAMLRGMSNRRTTMSNLAATLALVDREQPRLSPLLTVPRRTHGGMKEPVFGPRREAAFRHLYEWVTLVTADTAKPSPAAPPEGSVEAIAVEGATTSHLSSPDMRLEQPTADNSVPALFQESVDAQLPKSGELELPAAAGEQTPRRYGARLEHWQPRDPFDPEIFNRKYSPLAKARENSDASKPIPQTER